MFMSPGTFQTLLSLLRMSNSCRPLRTWSAPTWKNWKLTRKPLKKLFSKFQSQKENRFNVSLYFANVINCEEICKKKHWIFFPLLQLLIGVSVGQKLQIMFWMLILQIVFFNFRKFGWMKLTSTNGETLIRGKDWSRRDEILMRKMSWKFWRRSRRRNLPRKRERKKNCWRIRIPNNFWLHVK